MGILEVKQLSRKEIEHHGRESEMDPKKDSFRVSNLSNGIILVVLILLLGGESVQENQEFFMD